MLTENIKRLRKEKGLTQKDMSDVLNVTQSAYGFYENGNREIKNDVLIQLANYFNVSTDYLLDNEKSNSPIYKETAKIQKAFDKVDEGTRKRMLDMLEIAFPQAFDEYEWALNVLKEQNVQAFSMLNEGTTELSKNDVINMAKAIKGEK